MARHYGCAIIAARPYRPRDKAVAARHVSARTVAKILTLLGSVFHYGEDIELVSRNPVARVKKPRAAVRPILILEPEQIQRLLGAVDDPRERRMVEVELMTGLRSDRDTRMT